MSRLSPLFERLAAEGKKALVPYIVAGDPHPNVTVAIMHALVEQGADIIELGIPFSDPMAEGPTIQLAHERALAHGTSLTNALAMVAEFRQSNSETAVVLMGYANPVNRMGFAQFADKAADAGVDGLLTVDLPPEEAEALNVELKRVNIDNIFLLAPTTTDERIAKVAALASGYLYAVSLKGVTGAGNLDLASVKSQMERIQKYTDLPVTVGFGIKDAESAAAIAPLCEGVVVGSALVDRILNDLGEDVNGADIQQIARAVTMIGEMRSAID